MVRVFLDSSVLIAASASNKGASYAVVLLGEIGLIKVVISSQVLEEWGSDRYIILEAMSYKKRKLPAPQLSSEMRTRKN